MSSPLGFAAEIGSRRIASTIAPRKCRHPRAVSVTRSAFEVAVFKGAAWGPVLDAFAHGDEVAFAVEFFAVGGAVGFLRGEGLGAWFLRRQEALLEFVDAGREGDEGVGERVLDVVRIGDENPL